jgi:hypothetical protein
MKAMTNDQFAEAVLRMADSQEPFKPSATYIPEGDCIEFLVAPDNYRARRIDGLVTVYYSRKTNRVIGGLIKGVHAFCKKMEKKCPGFRLSIAVRPVRVDYFFLAQLWTQPRSEGGSEFVRAYQELLQMPNVPTLEVDAGDLCQKD